MRTITSWEYVDPAELKTAILRWYQCGEKADARVVYTELSKMLRLPPEFERALGNHEVQDLAEVAALKLMDRDRQVLSSAKSIRAYAKAVLKNLALDRLKKARHESTSSLNELQESRPDSANLAPNEDDPRDRIVDGIHAGDFVLHAQSVLSTLPLDARVAIALTYLPDRISVADWHEIAQRHPPPGPPRPTSPVGSDEASSLLWPPAGTEPKEDRRRRLERLRKISNRAHQRLAKELGRWR